MGPTRAAPHPPTPAARIKRAYKPRQQPVEALSAYPAQGSFLWRSEAFYCAEQQQFAPTKAMIGPEPEGGIVRGMQSWLTMRMRRWICAVSCYPSSDVLT